MDRNLKKDHSQDLAPSGDFDRPDRVASKKLATTVYITEEQQQLLKELNRRTRVPIAEFVREGIDLVLERHRALLPGQLDLMNLKS